MGIRKSIWVFVRASNLAIGDNVKYTKYLLYELYVFDQFHIIDKLNRKANCFITERIVYITIYFIIRGVCCCCLRLFQAACLGAFDIITRLVRFGDR